MPAADLVLKNASVITMDGGRPRARLVAVKGDRVLGVGGDGDLEPVVGRGTRIIDCAGRTVVPGFNDAHCHIFSFIRKLLSVDLAPESVSSIADVKEAIRRKAENTPPGEWISGTGLNEFYLAEKRLPNRRDIDEVAPGHPVVISHRSLHGCILNSLALSLAGITAETPEPEGAMIERELDTGEPNGVLYQMLGHIRERVMPPLMGEALEGAAALANQHYLSSGITSLQDATVSNDYGRWETLGKLKAAERLRSRITMMHGYQTRGRFQAAGLSPRSGDNQLRLGAVKFMLVETRGQLHPPQPELNEMALGAHREGFQLAFHAVTPAAVEAAITALEYVNAQSPVVSRRHRLEHCAECHGRLLERLRRLGAVIATQPPFLYYNGERYLASLPAGHLPWLYRLRSFMEGGIVVAASSDSPIVPHSPLVGVHAAVNRKAANGRDVNRQERVSAAQALAMYTVNAAYASFEEGEKGAISPGKLADLVLLSEDPTDVPPERIKDIRVEMTVIGGKVVWEA